MRKKDKIDTLQLAAGRIQFCNMVKKISLTILIICISFISLISCSYQTQTVTEIDNEVGEFYIPTQVPQPESGKGSVVGQIVSDDPEDTIGLIVYLGELISLPENMYGAYLNSKTAPSSVISPETGRFYFKDVQPGMYSLIIYEVVMGGMVYQDSNGSAIPIKVISDEILDLGKIELYSNSNK